MVYRQSRITLQKVQMKSSSVDASAGVSFWFLVDFVELEFG
jgi:hypothetical protein